MSTKSLKENYWRPWKNQSEYVTVVEKCLPKLQIIHLIGKMNRYADIPYEKMQLTLRYMTKLDRAINNERELKELNEFYKSRNISALELFKILEMVSVRF
jgi:hypothetical protein